MSRLFLALFLLLSCGACAGRVTNTASGAVAGTALGSGLGAIIGSATGHAGAGTAIGAGVGALTGTLMGAWLDNGERKNEAARQQISLTDEQIAENERLIRELRSRGTDARMTDRGVAINLPDILFQTGQSTLSPDARTTISEIASVIREKTPGRVVLVEGHTDAVGGEEYNQNLSEQRADTVARTLIDGGVSRRQVRSKGFGEYRPIASNNDAAGRQRNRRVEIVVER